MLAASATNTQSDMRNREYRECRNFLLVPHSLDQAPWFYNIHDLHVIHNSHGSSDRDHFQFGVNAPDQALYPGERAGNGTGATAARALVVYFQRAAFQTDDVEVTAVALQIMPHFLVQ